MKKRIHKHLFLWFSLGARTKFVHPNDGRTIKKLCGKGYREEVTQTETLRVRGERYLCRLWETNYPFLSMLNRDLEK